MNRLYYVLVVLILSVAGASGADVVIKNDGGNTVDVKVGTKTEQISIGKTKSFKLGETFDTEVKVSYDGKVVASTTLKPSKSDVKLKLYREKGSWLLKVDK